MRSYSLVPPGPVVAALLAALAALAAPAARAHVRLDPEKSPKPRSSDSGLKVAPCGNIPATTDDTQRTVLTAGATVTIYWEETINHTSHFRIAYAPDGDTDFDQHIIKDNILDDQSTPVTYTDPATYHHFSTKITVPDTPCDHCTLQLIQVMLDNPAAPSDYHSCADIKIVKGDAAAPPSPSPPSPAPSPTTAEKPTAPTGLKVQVQALPAEDP